MDDLFNLKSEVTPKQKLIEQFSNWWSDDEIKDEIIPSIVDKKIKPSIIGALKNPVEVPESERKSFAEILYDLVGQNFLVSKDKSIRINFLYFILRKKAQEDSDFETRFLQYLDDCSLKQQSQKIPKISEREEFLKSIKKFKLNRNYKRLCGKLIDELDFPSVVKNTPSKMIKLLPDVIQPLGNFSNLFDYQSSIGLKILDMLENYSIDTSRAMVVLPTGAGKTRLVVETLVDWINNGKKGKEKSKFILWIVDKKELCQQAFDTFAYVFRHRGKRDTSLKLHPIYGDHTKNIRDILYQYSEDGDEGEISEENGIIIASIQSLYHMTKQDDKGSLDQLAEYLSMVIIDEAHHAVPSNKSYTTVLRTLGFEFRNVSKKDVDIHKHKVRLLGLTATPFRGNEEGEGTRDLLNRFGKRHRILWPPFTEDSDVENIPPFAHIDVQKTAFQGERIKIYGDRSYDKDGKITEYRFMIYKLFSGTTYTPNTVICDKSTPEKNIEYAFEEPGRYQIQLVVTDNSGEISKNLAAVNVEVRSISEQEEKATPEEMKKLYKNLIDRSILSVPHHYVIDNTKDKINLDKEKDIERFKQFHDITDETIREIGNNPYRNNKIIEKIVSLVKTEKRKSILLFACSILHSKYLSFVLDAIHGIKSASIDHTVSTEERDQIIQDFRNEEITVLCNYDILTTGFDSPKVECVFVARPTFSHLLYNQMIGRGLRGPKSGGTENCIIVDISDNIQLFLEKDPIEQPWRILEYMYDDNVYDERDKSKKDQKCYGCFGDKRRKIDDVLKDCYICNGNGIIPQKIDKEENPVVKPSKETLKKKQYEIFAKDQNLTLKEINERAKKDAKYDSILSSKKPPTRPVGEWGALCTKCNKVSYDMGKTLASFGRSEDLISYDNPKGIYDECKECREND